MATKTVSAIPFLDDAQSKQIVSQALPDVDKDRLEDVAKMLHVIARDLQNRTGLSESTKEFLEQKRKKRKLKLFDVTQKS